VPPVNKAILAILALLASFLPLATVAGDDQTPGDDLVETSFSGVVSDSTTLEPIKGVCIYGFDDTYQEYNIDYTNDKGEYYFEFNRGGHYTLYTEHSGYEQATADDTVERNEDTVIDFQLVPKVFDTLIFGIVSDSKTGDPLPEVYIEIYEMVEQDNGDSILTFLDYQITGHDGKYSIEAYEGTFLFSASREDYNDYIAEITVESGEQYRLDISLRQWTTGITGVVMDGSNSGPLMGVTVTLECPWGSFSNTTDENGIFEILLPQGGEHTLKAFKDGYQPFNRDIEVQDSSMNEFDFVMKEALLPGPLLQIVYFILSLIGYI
jgi:hypothetical protein